MENPNKHIALLGNPNCGKSTLFNRLTGLRQRTSNLPGTTVEKKQGIWATGNLKYTLTDLPGIYSLYTANDDEKVVVSHLLNPVEKRKPEAILFLLNAHSLRRNLLLFTQVAELGIPMVVALTMSDTASRNGKKIDAVKLSTILQVPVIEVNPRKGTGIPDLEHAILQAAIPTINLASESNIHSRLADFHTGKTVPGLHAETLGRYTWIEPVVKEVVSAKSWTRASLTLRMDKLLTHKIYGFIFFAFLMLTIFQGVFTLAEYPMQWIETGFGYLSQWVHHQLADGFLTRMLADGLIPGIAGVVVFVPQIAILFFFIGLLEDSGYMVRASFITDKLMRKVGLNGRSVIPLMGGFACAIPSIMATRSIRNKSERLLTMFITPLMSCSARLPVYVLLVSLAVPAGSRFGPVGLQSLVMTLAYFSGIILAAIIARLFILFRKPGEVSEFILEMPPYQAPRLQNVITHVWHKSRSFVVEAGKIIVLISVILWVLSSYGPGNSMELAESDVYRTHEKTIMPDGKRPSHDELQAYVASARLEASYAGRLGKFIEPAIQPLGYDWKTGIALISSFAAREVFVGTMNTLFLNSPDGEVIAIREKMQKAENPDTGKPRYGVPYALSLMMFYAFALQCMSTMAVMKRETGTWKWPLLQFFLFGAIAWLAAFAVYRISVAFV
ncbi:MAG: ferrous iron transport protein B [Bacteroidetes bacterium]|nr:ferrous iron transport protein B [Bacteroidota bacterium]